MTAYPKKSESIEEILRKFRQYLVHGVMSDTPEQLDFEETTQALEALYNQRMERENIKLKSDLARAVGILEGLGHPDEYLRTRAGINKKEEV